MLQEGRVLQAIAYVVPGVSEADAALRLFLIYLLLRFASLGMLHSSPNVTLPCPGQAAVSHLPATSQFRTSVGSPPVECLLAAQLLFRIYSTLFSVPIIQTSPDAVTFLHVPIHSLALFLRSDRDVLLVGSIWCF